MKNHVIIVVLLLFLALTSFFWFQVLSIKDLPPAQRTAPPLIDGGEAEAFVNLAQELLINYREPMPGLYGRDPFYRVEKVETVLVKKKEPSEMFNLSSIIYSTSHSYAVVNGEILAEGDTIHDQESGTEYMIASIESDKVEIIDGGKEYILKLARGVSGKR